MTTKRTADSATKLRPRLTDDQKLEIGEKLQQGVAATALAEQYGKSVQTIANLRSTSGGSVQVQSSRQSGDSKLKSRLLQFAVAILTDPEAVSEIEKGELAKLVQHSMRQNYLASL